MDTCQVYGLTVAKPTHAISDVVAIRRIRPNPSGFVQDMLSLLIHPQVGSNRCSEVMIQPSCNLAVRISRTQMPVSPIRHQYLQYDASISNMMPVSPIRCQYLQYDASISSMASMEPLMEHQNSMARMVWQLAKCFHLLYILKVAFCMSPCIALLPWAILSIVCNTLNWPLHYTTDHCQEALERRRT
jgi:hypothetical protein